MEKILQFGEGNFLRAFLEDYIEEAIKNGYDGSVVITQPRTNTNTINELKKHSCEYDIKLKGLQDGKVINTTRHISCVSRALDQISEYNLVLDCFCSENTQIIVSNTTEAGIVFDKKDKMDAFPNISFPAKITLMLLERFKQCQNDIVFLPVELIENNGLELKRCILSYAKLWDLPELFVQYVNTKCHFCDTLVDRIVTGRDLTSHNGCDVCCEPYKSLIVRCDEFAKSVIPFKNAIFTDDIDAYRTKKVRILNGTHTMSVLGAYQLGENIVRDMLKNEKISAFVEEGLNEIIESLDFDKTELKAYASTVIERFLNPYIDHKILDISLNSISKFKARVLPSIVDYSNKFGSAPKALSKSFAYLIGFYNHISPREYTLKDSPNVLDFFKNEKSVKDVLCCTDFWDDDLTQIPNLLDQVERYYEQFKLDLQNK